MTTNLTLLNVGAVLAALGILIFAVGFALMFVWRMTNGL